MCRQFCEELLSYFFLEIAFLANVTTLRSLIAVAIPFVCRLSVCCLSSVVCDVGAPYSGG